MSGAADREPPIASVPAPAEIIRRAIAAAYHFYGAKRYGEASELCARILRGSPDQSRCFSIYRASFAIGRATTAQPLSWSSGRAVPAQRSCDLDHLAGLLKQRGEAGWLVLHETRLSEFHRSPEDQCVCRILPEVRAHLGAHDDRKVLAGRQARRPAGDLRPDEGGAGHTNPLSSPTTTTRNSSPSDETLPG